MSDDQYLSTQNKEICTENRNNQAEEEEKICEDTVKEQESVLHLDVNESEESKDERDGYTPVQEPIIIKESRPPLLLAATLPDNRHLEGNTLILNNLNTLYRYVTYKLFIQLIVYHKFLIIYVRSM